MHSRTKIAVMNIPESEFEALLRYASDSLRKQRKSRLLKPRSVGKKRSSAA